MQIVKRSTFWCVVLGMLLGISTIPKVRSLDSPDFKVFYVAAQNAIHSPELLYRKSPDRYLYPPSASLLFVPFAFSDSWNFHRWTWHFCLTALVIAMMLRFQWAGVAGVVLLMRYFIINFFYGQVNLVLLALLVFAVLSSQKKPRLSAVAWGVASIWKLFPALFGFTHLCLAWKEKKLQPLQAWLVGGTAVVALVLLPFLLWGSEISLQLYREFLLALEAKGLPLNSHNQSFLALLMRLFTTQVFELHSVAYVKWGLYEIAPPILKLISYSLMLVLSGFAWKKAYERGSQWDFLCATCFSILFLSHIVWKDYFTFLFPPIVALFGLKTKRAYKLLVIFGLLTLFSSPDLIGHPRSAFLDACCIHFWGAVLVFGGWYFLKSEVFPHE